MAEIHLSSSSSSPTIPTPVASLCLSIWPPSQRTRDAVLARLVHTLASSSILSKSYGTVPKENASALARRIEEEAFSTAAAVAFPSGPDQDGIDTLQVYSREISKLILHAVKNRVASGTCSSSSPAFLVDADSTPNSAADEM